MKAIVPWWLLADIVLVVHALFVLFVVAGQMLILIGLWRGWTWVRRRSLRQLHLLAIAVVVVQSWLGILCPLTIVENELRMRAGGNPYAGSFVRYWLHRIMFYDVEPWVFTAVYTIFGGVVILTWVLARPDRPRR